MSEEREPTLRDVLHAVQGIEAKVHANGAAILEIGGELGEVRVGLGDVRGRLDRLGGEVAEQGRRLDGRLDALTGKVGELRGEVTEQGHRLDGLTGEVETLGRETRELRTELPAQVVAGVLVGFERSAYATDLRALQAEVAELKADVAELKRASGKENGAAGGNSS